VIYELNKTFLFEKTKQFDFNKPLVDPKEFAKNIKESLLQFGGVGLAANQVGFDFSAFVFGPSKQLDNFEVMFNPQIVYFSEEKNKLEEGCLSFPGLIVDVERSNEIRIRFQDVEGITDTIKLTGLSAKIVQHEVEHLNGEVFFKNLSKLKLQMAIKKAKKLGFNYENDSLFKFLKK